MTSEDDTNGGAGADDDRADDITVDPEWTEEKDDEMYAPWEELIAGIVGGDITALDVGSDSADTGAIDREEAVRNLVRGVDEVNDDRHAEALIEALREEGIVRIEDGAVVVLPAVEGGEKAETPKYLYNWAAAMQLARTKVDDQLERCAELGERSQTLEGDGPLAGPLDDEDPEAQMDWITGQLEDIGDGEGIPNPVTLSPDQRREYHRYNWALQIARDRTFAAELQEPVENLQHLQQAFTEYEKKLRTMVRTRQWRPSEDQALFDSVTKIVDNIVMCDQAIEERDTERMDSALDGVIESTSEVSTLEDSMEEISHEEMQAILDELADSAERTHDGDGHSEFRDSFVNRD